MEKIYFFLIFFLSSTIFSQLVLKDGYVYQDGNFEVLDISIANEKILKIGKNLKGKEYESLKGLYIYPGFVDAHLHIFGIGKEMEEVNLKNTKSMDEIIEKIKEKFPNIEKNKWIIGRGWDQNLFQSKELPDNKLLSEVFKENPVVLFRVDGHMLLANKKAIELAMVKEEEKIEGGKIIFEKGIFSDKAMEKIIKTIPEPDLTEIENTLKNSLNHLKNIGIVAVSDAGIDFKTLKAYISLSRKNKIPIIVYAMLEADDPNFEEIIKNGPINNEFFKMQTVKVYMDGALGSWGAYLSKPYKDKPEIKGNLVTDFEKLCKILELCKKYNFKVSIHSIGDEATTIALNAIEKVKMKPFSVRLEHLQILKPKDLKRMSKLKVVGSVQPYHYFSDLKFLYERIDKNSPFLFYPWKTLLEKKILLLFGSDAPVESPDFFEGFFSSILRKEEGLLKKEALKAYTLNNFIFYNEKNMGKIKKGYYANFTILNKDIFKEINGVYVWGTMVKGKWVLRR